MADLAGLEGVAPDSEDSPSENIAPLKKRGRPKGGSERKRDLTPRAKRQKQQPERFSPPAPSKKDAKLETPLQADDTTGETKTRRNKTGRVLNGFLVDVPQVSNIGLHRSQ